MKRKSFNVLPPYGILENCCFGVRVLGVNIYNIYVIKMLNQTSRSVERGV